MDESLFEKYKKTIIETNKDKEKIIEIIKKESGISLKENQIIIEKDKNIILSINSIQKTILKLKNCGEKLKKEGYIIKFNK